MKKQAIIMVELHNFSIWEPRLDRDPTESTAMNVPHESKVCVWRICTVYKNFNYNPLKFLVYVFGY